MSLLDRAADRLRALAAPFRDLAPAPPPAAPVSPAAADAAPPRRTRGIVDRASDLFAGRFFPREESPRTLLDGEWEPRTPYPDVILDMLGRTGLARRVLALRALDATREGWEVRFPSLPPDKARAAAKRLDAMQSRLSVQFKMYLGLLKAEQFGEAIVVIGVDDGQSLDQPLDPAAVRRVLWLKVFARPDYVPGPLSPATSENFDLPEHYEVSDFFAPSLRSLDAAQRGSGSVRVHHTRVLRFATEEGFSRLDEVGQALEDYFAAMRSGRRAASVFSVAVWSIADWVSKWVKDDEGALNKLGLQHMAMKRLGAVVVDKEKESFSWQAQPSTGLSDLIGKSESQVCAWTGYPIMILFGADPAGFSTGGEVIRHYYDTVRVWQTLRVAPQLRRLLELLMVSEEGPDDIMVAPDDWSISFRPLRVLTAEEQAKVRDVVSRTLGYLKSEQVIDRDEARASIPHDGDDVPDVRLSGQTITDQRERLEVGIVQAVTALVTEYYQRTPAPTPEETQALRATVAAMIPELADRVDAFFTERAPAGATEELGDDASVSEAELAAEREALAAAPEQWLEADQVREHFSVSKATLRKYRAERRGVDVDPGSGRYRWIAPDGRPRYRLSEVRSVLESGSSPPAPPVAPAADPVAVAPPAG